MHPDSPEFKAYQAILAGHQELKALLERIDQILANRSGTIEEACHLLAQLGDRLVKHFAMEEGEGYFEEAVLHAPQLVAKMNHLLAQHPKMCSQAQSLVAEASSRSGQEDWWETTRRLFLSFRDELLRHERAEDRLLQEAYNLDIGSHD